MFIVPSAAVAFASLLLRVDDAQPGPGSLPPPVSPACISSPFGPRHYVGPQAPAGFHYGIDLPAPAGGYVRAVLPGEVIAIVRTGAAGLRVDLRHPGGLVTRYAHLGAVTPALATGKRTVAAGEPLGRVGRTGVTYGTHLYFELLRDGVRIDPEPYFPIPRCGR